jgi:hypothetical protein
MISRKMITGELIVMVYISHFNAIGYELEPMILQIS